MTAIAILIATLLALAGGLGDSPSVEARDRASVASVPALAARGEIGTAYSGRRGSATWCAPTPRHCQSWGGNAHVGAMRSFRYGDRPYNVVVSWRGRSTMVRIVSYCACPNTLIDLSPAAFTELAPLSRGRLYGVTVEGFDLPQPPATDTE